MQLETTIEYLLAEWGNWAVDGLGLMLCSQSEGKYSEIDDSTALLVDQAIALLGQTHPKAQQVIELYYRKQLSFRKIAITINVGETKTRHMHISSVAWLEGHLMAKGLLLQRAA
ncbi:hypothetical protein GCM10011369_23290 [Neiella marina]|uniref:Antitermination protein Q n=1 Tax=Neiella marina TaxID=508461 RepID=A0A8J2XPJ6_9GAMM|nr:antiterminator Q family protein [Neiella marina]GGA80683.1 hypothetical protein GCM10011369_23290 [Neiella marina]